MLGYSNVFFLDLLLDQKLGGETCKQRLFQGKRICGWSCNAVTGPSPAKCIDRATSVCRSRRLRCLGFASSRLLALLRLRVLQTTFLRIVEVGSKDEETLVLGYNGAECNDQTPCVRVGCSLLL